MERRRLGNTDLTVSIIGLGCYGMSGAYGPADDAESVATIRRAAMLAGLPHPRLRDANIAHPTMAEGLTTLFANLPPR